MTPYIESSCQPCFGRVLVKTLALWVAHAPSPETHNHHPLVCAYHVWYFLSNRLSQISSGHVWDPSL